MCGRYGLFASGDELAEWFKLAETPPFEPRYNIAPTQTVAVVRPAATGREFVFLQWGFLPPWARDATRTYPIINVRVETAAEKPSFQSAFKSRRCLIPASGFYEWQKAGNRHKQPYFIRPKGGGLFAFAGLWEGETCTILTTEANDLMRPLHERMPVIVGRDVEASWLESAALAPYPSDLMEAYPVATWVNSPKHEGPRCAEPA
jgi:putative SOS response-associated peptidase YedK